MTLQNVKISLKTDDLSNWTSFNPVLNDGELAIVNDISANLTKFKVGNGLSTFTQLPYVDDKIVTNYLQANDVQAHHFSQGVHAESSPLGLAAGYFLSAAANFSQVMGVNAQAAAGTDYSFVWNGNDVEALGQYYSAHGKGSFNINPLSGISGVYVGEQTLADIIDSNVSSKQDALDDAQMSAVNSGITSGKVQKYDGYEATIQQKIELSDIPSDLSSFTNSPGYLVSNDISDYYKKSETSSAAEISDAFELSSGNKVFIDDHILSSAGYSDLSVVKLSASEYEALVSTSATISNALYIVEDEFEDAYGQQVKNMAPGTDLSDAVNVEQLSNAINNIQIPTDLSSFTNSPGYLVSNDISDYYKKSETSSASEISSALAEIASLSGIQQIVWADLAGLAQTSALAPGMKYRITDYVATVANQSDARSAAAGGLSVGFDIIVTADSTSKLNEKANAIRHAGNTYYPNTTKFEAWQVLYCLDNDTTRFAWADTTNGKGVVYRLVDEFNNDVPYDFKGIQFKVYGDTDNVWRWTFDNGAASNNLDSSKDGSSFNNNISKYKLASGYKNYALNRNIFKGDCHCNRLDYNCHDNTFGDNCNYNILGSGCYNNISDSDSGNVFGIECHDNTLGNWTYSNVLNDGCSNISIGDECYQNTFQENCSNIVFGNECNGMVFGNNCNNIKFGNSSSVTSATAKSYCRYINIASGNQYIVLNATGTTSDSSYYQNIDIKPGVNNTTTYKMITDSNVNQSFCTTYQPANSQVIAI